MGLPTEILDGYGLDMVPRESFKLERIEKHWSWLSQLVYDRMLGPDPEELSPKTGFRYGPCAGFVYIAKGAPVAHLDSYICEPGTDRDLRVLGFSRLTRALVLLAKIHGCKIITGHTWHRNMLDVFSDLGFSVGKPISSHITKAI